MVSGNDPKLRGLSFGLGGKGGIIEASKYKAITGDHAMAKQDAAKDQASAVIEVGAQAPDFSLGDQRSNTQRLSDYRGSWVVLYFYPRDNTPGCTKQACQFRDADRELKRRGAAVLGVSPQGEQSHARFAEKQELPFPLLADTECAVAQQYGVFREKRVFGKTGLGIVRTTYLIDPEGVVRERFDHVKVAEHAQAVLDRLDALMGE
jgi:peroxiredoxin Q/BCP